MKKIIVKIPIGRKFSKFIKSTEKICPKLFALNERGREKNCFERKKVNE